MAEVMGTPPGATSSPLSLQGSLASQLLHNSTALQFWESLTSTSAVTVPQANRPPLP